MSIYSFEPSAMKHIIPFRFHGRTFRAYCAEQLFHPSVWTFLDESETRDEWWQVQPGDYVMDVGADFGSYTLTALACGAAHVTAWSPPFKRADYAIEAETLLRSAGLNGWADATRLSIRTDGLWSKAGWLAAFDGPRMAQWHETPEAAQEAIAGQDGHVVVFPVQRLDELDRTPVDWLKIDAEGAELDILQGGRETIETYRPRIILEHHYHLDPACEDKCDAWLRERRYIKHGTRAHGAVAHSMYLP